MHNGKNSHKVGASLLELLIAVGVLGVVAVGFARLIDNNNRSIKNSELKLDKQGIIQSLRRQVDCPELAGPSNVCSHGAKFVDVKARSGNQLISKNGTLFGSFTVRAECSPGNDALILRMVRLSSHGDVNSTKDSDFIPDPLTKKIVKWSDPGSLAQPQGVNFCPTSGDGMQWVAVEYDDPPGKVGWQLFSFIKGNLSPDEFCVSKGFKGAGTACKHDDSEPPQYRGQDWGSGFSGQASFQATKFPHAPFNNRWAISCPTHYWQKPDFINCLD